LLLVTAETVVIFDCQNAFLPIVKILGSKTTVVSVKALQFSKHPPAIPTTLLNVPDKLID
jgi:hypothetical protein